MCLLGAGLTLMRRSQFGFGDFVQKKGDWNAVARLIRQCVLITLP